MPPFLSGRRNFTTAGVAAGVAAAFNAPIGGILFAIEDISSFWSKKLSWQTFFCCVISTTTAALLKNAANGPFGLLGVLVGYTRAHTYLERDRERETYTRREL